jgi:hypothetical protein
MPREGRGVIRAIAKANNKTVSAVKSEIMRNFTHAIAETLGRDRSVWLNNLSTGLRTLFAWLRQRVMSGNYAIPTKEEAKAALTAGVPRAAATAATA